MPKIPLTKTIEDAYGFTFRNILSVFGVGWLPMVIMFAGIYFVAGPYIAAMQAVVETNDPAAFLALIPHFVLVSVLFLLATAMMFVGMTQLVMGQLQTPVYFYFSLGYPVWRFLGALLCAYLGYIAIIFGLILAGTFIGGALVAAGGEVIAGLLAVIGFIVLFWLMFYLLLRLFFFLAPVTVAEGRRVVRRAFSLARGNAWRIFVIVLACFLPTACVQGIVQGSVMGQAMMSMTFPLPGEELPPEQAIALVNDIFAQFAAVLPILVPVWIITSIFMYGVWSAAAAYAYRELLEVSGPDRIESQ